MLSDILEYEKMQHGPADLEHGEHTLTLNAAALTPPSVAFVLPAFAAFAASAHQERASKLGQPAVGPASKRLCPDRKALNLEIKQELSAFRWFAC
jgi:hypothetical protein